MVPGTVRLKNHLPILHSFRIKAWQKQFKAKLAVVVDSGCAGAGECL